MTDLLEKMILEKDLAAVDLARQLGSSAGESAKRLFTNGDAAVRRLAIHSAYEAGTRDLSSAVAPLLTDDSPSVRTAVLVVLRKRMDSKIYPELLEIFPRIPDADDRMQLALIIGDISGARIADLKKLRDEESHPAAREGCLVALAKLGDVPSEHQFLDALDEARGQTLKRYLDHAEYIAQPWLLPGLARLLNNPEPLVFIGSFHVSGPGPDYLRVCDLAVDLIAKISNARFSFATGGAVNYTGSQLEEVREFSS